MKVQKSCESDIPENTVLLRATIYPEKRQWKEKIQINLVQPDELLCFMNISVCLEETVRIEENCFFVLIVVAGRQIVLLNCRSGSR